MLTITNFDVVLITSKICTRNQRKAILYSKRHTIVSYGNSCLKIPIWISLRVRKRQLGPSRNYRPKMWLFQKLSPPHEMSESVLKVPNQKTFYNSDNCHWPRDRNHTRYIVKNSKVERFREYTNEKPTEKNIRSTYCV